ncbi:MAG TPA: hypothetical protein DIT04_01570 [Dysgonomonas sp.]|nr:hypothetical protein [Dysgonomonas sp.]
MIQTAAIIGSILFLVVICFYILAATGAPLGDYMMGGKYKILPKKLRIMVSAAVFIQVLAIIVLLQGGGVIASVLPAGILKVLCYIFSIYFSLNVLMNLFSESKKEKMLMTPLSLITAVCFWIVTLNL